MTNWVVAFIPLVLLLAFLTLRNPGKAKAQQERPDFLIEAAESMKDAHDSALIDSGSQALDDSEYVYDVVGESLRDNVPFRLKQRTTLHHKPPITVFGSASGGKKRRREEGDDDDDDEEEDEEEVIDDDED
jgi:hypothetical protein